MKGRRRIDWLRDEARLQSLVKEVQLLMRVRLDPQGIPSHSVLEFQVGGDCDALDWREVD